MAPRATFTFPDDVQVGSLATPLAADEGHFYYPAPDLTSIERGDWTTGESKTLATLPAGHTVAGLAAAGGWLVYVEAWKDVAGTQMTPCKTNDEEPLNWSITALSLVTGRRAAIDAGLNRQAAAYPGHEVCIGPDAPHLAISGSVVAYDREDSPAAIVVRSLLDASVVRQVPTTHPVVGLATLAAADGSRPVLAWVEQPATGDSRLLLDGRQIAQGVDDLALSSDADGAARLTWVSSGDAASTSVWSSRPPAEPSRIGGGLDSGWTPVGADATHVVWGQVATDSTQPVPIEVWDVAGVRRTPVQTPIDPARVWLVPGGWLAWAGAGVDANGRISELGYAIRLLAD